MWRPAWWRPGGTLTIIVRLAWTLALLLEPVVPATPLVDCQELTSTDPLLDFELSYEGSWSFLRFNRMCEGCDPANTPGWKPPPMRFAMGALGYSVYTDMSPGWFRKPFFGLLLPDILALQCSHQPEVSYAWRPDFVSFNGTCDDSEVSLTVGYQSNGTICARFEFAATASPRTVSFVGAPPNPNQTDFSASASGGASGGGAVLTRLTAWSRNGMPMNITRWWLMQSEDVAGSPTVTSEGGYIFTAHLPAGLSHNVSFCLSELEYAPALPPPPMPAYAPALTTAKINTWLADAAEPTALARSIREGGGSAEQKALKQYYRSWFQYWYNTEHDAGNWVAPIVCPARGYYGGAIWLWDTGFHVHGLLTGGPLGLAKAIGQLTVLFDAALKIGHLPTMVGVNQIKEGTQPPGILTWAAFAAYNRTGDKTFLAVAYDACAQNNRWYLPHNLTNPSRQRQDESIGYCDMENHRPFI